MTLLIKDLGYELTKQEFSDTIRVRYDWTESRLNVHVEPHLMSHTLLCKKVASSHYGTMRYEGQAAGKGLCGCVERTSPRRTQQQATSPTSKQKQGSSSQYQRIQLLDE